MSEDKPEPGDRRTNPPVISYESSPVISVRRPRWVYPLLTGYLLVIGAMLVSPLLLMEKTDLEPAIVAAAAILLLILCGVGLIIVPVKIKRRRPITRRTILIPIIISGFLVGVLALGGGFALAELFAPETSSDAIIMTRQSTTAAWVPAAGSSSGSTAHDPSAAALWSVAGSAVAIWIGWAVIFILIGRRRDPAAIGMKLHRLLIAGSVLELLIAVPAHLIVRRRSDCCAGVYTGTGICIGVVIAVIAFGPTVLLLYYQRAKQIAVPVVKLPAS